VCLSPVVRQRHGLHRSEQVVGRHDALSTALATVAEAETSIKHWGSTNLQEGGRSKACVYRTGRAVQLFPQSRGGIGGRVEDCHSV
jgi:hypothetical protein